MIGAYDDYGNVVDLVEWEKQIRENAIDECIKFIKNSIPNEEAFTKCLLVKGLEQLKE